MDYVLGSPNQARLEAESQVEWGREEKLWNDCYATSRVILNNANRKTVAPFPVF